MVNGENRIHTRSTRPKRAALPSARLRDTENAAKPQLRFHRSAIASLPTSSKLPSPKDHLDDVNNSSSPPTLSGNFRERKCAGAPVDLYNILDLKSDDEDLPDSLTRLVKGKKRARPTPTVKDRQEGIVNSLALQLPQDTPDPMDIEVIDFDEQIHIGSVEENIETAKFARKRGASQPTVLVAGVTTCRRHLDSCHREEYLKWAKDDNFVSMLPKDCRQRKESTTTGQQSQLDSYLQPVVAKEIPAQYSDQLFREAAIRWIINTDQPLSALEHPAFKKMISLAARAPDGVKIPTRESIYRLVANDDPEEL